MHSISYKNDGRPAKWLEKLYIIIIYQHKRDIWCTYSCATGFLWTRFAHLLTMIFSANTPGALNVPYENCVQWRRISWHGSMQHGPLNINFILRICFKERDILIFIWCIFDIYIYILMDVFHTLTIFVIILHELQFAKQDEQCEPNPASQVAAH